MFVATIVRNGRNVRCAARLHWTCIPAVRGGVGRKEVVTAAISESSRPVSLELNGVSCASSSACVAVGDSFAGGSALNVPLVGGWNGRQWTIEQVPLPEPSFGADLYGVSCTSPSACTAVGQYYPRRYGNALPLVERWTGGRWSVQTTPNPRSLEDATLYGVSCTSGRSCMAVGLRNVPPREDPVSAPLAQRWNGARWSTIPTPRFKSDVLSGVSCVSRDDCLAVGTGLEGGQPELIGGGSQVAERWNGKRWTIEHPPQP